MLIKPVNDTTEYLHGICTLNAVPVYSKPMESTQVISQLLYGESFNIIYRKNKLWFYIQPNNCSVLGWIKSNQIQLIDEKMFIRLNAYASKSLEISHTVLKEDSSRNIVMGSTLPLFDGISLTMPDGKSIFNGQATNREGLEKTSELIVKIARRYLNTPELSGGRTPFGIDSGALVQLIFGFFNIHLPRFPSEQCQYGEDVYFMDFVQEGDVIFCENKDGRIAHAGIIVGEKRVLHVYGNVRIDDIDHFGIFNQNIRRYTHQLRIVKRLIPFIEVNNI